MTMLKGLPLTAPPGAGPRLAAGGWLATGGMGLAAYHLAPATKLSETARILLVNLLPCDTASFSASDFPYSQAFKDGICEAEF